MPDMKKMNENLLIITTNKKTESKNNCSTSVKVQKKIFHLKVQCALL